MSNPNNQRYPGGTVRSYIDWHIRRGATRQQAINLAMRKFPNQGANRIGKMYGEVNAAYQAAIALRNRPKNTKLNQNNVPGFRPNGNGIRVHIRFRMGAIGDMPASERGFTLDLDNAKDLGDLLKKARKEIVDFLWEHYQNRLAGRRNLDARIKNLEILSVEGL